MSLINHRLPKTVIPINYKLHIQPNLEQFTFDGTVMINLQINSPTDTIILNSKKLTIKSVLFENELVKFKNNNEDEIIIITIPLINVIKNSGLYDLTIIFSGILNDQMEGFYRSKYKINNIIKYMATSQFESTDARQAFPCFDEPNFKATFDISITGPKDATILSNTEIKQQIDNDNTKTVIFETSPKMSTYLVAFIVSDLEYVEGKMRNNIIIRSYATPGNKSKLNFSLDIAIKALEYYTKWFEIDYPLSKLYLVAIPDFSAGAMENWGLITFREQAMLYDERMNLGEKQNIVYTICHEIAHQWFGNLVTMDWWTYLWLNESMATYFGWMVTDILFPEWQIWNKFMEHEYITALELDSLETSHPIEVPVQKSSDIQQIFDAISYSKGSCLIRFLVNYLGMDEFRYGMQRYLNKNMYGNTTSDDLWEAFGSNIKSLMKDWTQQTGYPVICASCTPSKHLTLSQSRFYKYGPDKIKDNTNRWTIPLELQLSKSENVSIVLDKLTNTYQLNTIEHLLINPRRMGFFRIQYIDLPNMENLPNMKNLSIEDKIHVLNDSFSLSLSGYQSFDKVFKMVDKLNLDIERNYNIWNSIVPYLNMIYVYLQNHKDIRENYKNKIMKQICKPFVSLLDNLGYDETVSESFNDYELRELIIDELVLEKNYDVINELIQRFRNNNWLSQKSLILPTVARYGNRNDYSKLLNIYQNNNDSSLVDPLLSAFGSVRDPALIRLSMELVLSDKIKDQDLWIYIRYLSNNEYTCNLLWDLVSTKWNYFMKKYPPGSSSIIYFVKVIASGFITKEQLEKYERLFENNMVEGIGMAVKQTIEKIENKILIVNRILSDPVFTS